MSNYTSSKLWQRTLSEKIKGKHSSEREKLRSAFIQLHDNASSLARKVENDLPSFVDHDVSHSDELWSIADILLGEKYPINPAEAFVLGSAFLIHDLGMALAAHRTKTDDTEYKTWYNDTLVLLLKKRLDRTPTEQEIAEATEEEKTNARREALREWHYQTAETLLQQTWTKLGTDEPLYLLDNPALRSNYGEIIGRIAKSHNESIDVIRNFSRNLGAMVGLPQEWTVDELKLACVLRAADACHLSASRAHQFLGAIRNPEPESKDYWIFQQHLLHPLTEHEKIKFTSGQPFVVDEASAWWKCYDSLVDVDRWLREVDDLFLSIEEKLRLAVRGVAHIESPEQLKKCIPTTGWEPVDARIKVGNVADLVEKLGGKQLYGEDAMDVPLRELIQNAADAIRARRLLEREDSGYRGRITVRIGDDAEGHWLEVEDNGVGMSVPVLTGQFLDFGVSFWGSNAMKREFPGLASKGFESSGKFGIGFFSVFMWGNHIKVTTRKLYSSRYETYFLEFTKGLKIRPLLRKEDKNDSLLSAGTKIKVWFDRSNRCKSTDYLKEFTSLTKILKRMCPALDSNLLLDNQLIIKENDWLEIDGYELMERVLSEDVLSLIEEDSLLKYLYQQAIRNIKIINNDDEKPVGRAAIFPIVRIDTHRIYAFASVVDHGILVGRLENTIGIFNGIAQSLSRNTYKLLAEKNSLSKWANDQAVCLASKATAFMQMISVPRIIKFYGDVPSDMILFFNKNGPVDTHKFFELMEKHEKVYIITSILWYTIKIDCLNEFIYNSEILFENVLFCETQGSNTVYMLKGYDNKTDKEDFIANEHHKINLLNTIYYLQNKDKKIKINFTPESDSPHGVAVGNMSFGGYEKIYARAIALELNR